MAKGAELDRMILLAGVDLPAFVSAILVGVRLSDFSLDVFLAVSFVSLDLVRFRDALLPIPLALRTQIAWAMAFARRAVFRSCKGNCDAAVKSAVSVDFDLGATPAWIRSRVATRLRTRNRWSCF